MVEVTDADGAERAVMVALENALVADGTVVGARGSVQLTSVTVLEAGANDGRKVGVGSVGIDGDELVEVGVKVESEQE